jgi:alpha-1,2-mannosyltransferase
MATAQLLLPLVKTGFPLIDFYAYLGAAQTIPRRQNPYTNIYPSPYGYLNYLYPPASFLFFSWLPLLALPLSKIIFTLLSLAAALISFILLQKTFLPRSSWTKILLITALLLQTFPVKLNLAFGQVNLFILFFISLSLYFLKRSPKLSALTLALATGLKPHPLMLVPAFIIRKKYRYVFIFLGLTLLLNLIFPALFHYYLISVVPHLNALTMSGTSMYNQSLSALLFRLTSSSASPFLAVMIIGILYILILIMLRPSSLSRQIAVLLALLSITPLNSWQHHLVLAYPLIIIFAKSWFYFIPIWLLLVWHPLVEPLPSLISPLLTSHHTLLLITLIIISLFAVPKKPLSHKPC